MPQSPPLVVPGGGQLTLFWTFGSATNGNNVLGVSVGGAVITQTIANTIGAAVKTAFTSNLATRVHTSVSLVAVGIRSVSTPNLPMFIDSGGAVSGSAVGDPLPRSVALCITLRTALSGQSNRGRVYLGGFTEAENESDATALAATNTAGVNFVSAIGTALTNAGMALAVLSRPAYATRTTVETFVAGQDPLVETSTTNLRGGAVNNVISVMARNDVWDSQRRRGAAGAASTLFRAPTAQVFLDEDATSPQEPASRRR